MSLTLRACLEAMCGNQGMMSASGIPIAVAITPTTTIWTIGRLRTLRSHGVWHPARILCVLRDERRRHGGPRCQVDDLSSGPVRPALRDLFAATVRRGQARHYGFRSHGG